MGSEKEVRGFDKSNYAGRYCTPPLNPVHWCCSGADHRRGEDAPTL